MRVAAFASRPASRARDSGAADPAKPAHCHAAGDIHDEAVGASMLVANRARAMRVRGRRRAWYGPCLFPCAARSAVALAMPATKPCIRIARRAGSVFLGSARLLGHGRRARAAHTRGQSSNTVSPTGSSSGGEARNVG
jgi:hypothetical protein